MERPTLIIGDVHGHYDRLEALLAQEGVVKDGKRVRDDVRVIQVGDLGHFGSTGSPTGDYLCYDAAPEWLDLVLWGNHDRAVTDHRHGFFDFEKPDSRTVRAMRELQDQGKMALAAQTHGCLITHAGLHPYFENEVPETLEFAVEFINNGHMNSMLDAVSRRRGGRQSMGGILWRDYEEDCSRKWPQVFGHSASPKVRHKQGSYCIDIGGRTDERLAGIWLPKEQVVRVDL